MGWIFQLDINEAQVHNAQAITPEITKAVEMTRGQVMTYDNPSLKLSCLFRRNNCYSR